MGSNLKTIVTIAVRMKSQRLPQKATAVIEGKPLIHHLIERVKAAKLPQSVIVCTSWLEEDQVLLQEAKNCAVSELAGNPEDVFERFLKAAEKEKADHVVRVTGDNPLTDPDVIDQLIQHHVQSEADYTTMDGLPLGVSSEVISVKALKKAQSELQDRAKSEYMTFILRNPQKYRVEVLEAKKEVRRPEYRLTVDTPADLELMQIIFGKLYHPKKTFSLEEVIRFLDQHPEKTLINQSVEQRKVFHA